MERAKTLCEVAGRKLPPPCPRSPPHIVVGGGRFRTPLYFCLGGIMTRKPFYAQNKRHSNQHRKKYQRKHQHRQWKTPLDEEVKLGSVVVRAMQEYRQDILKHGATPMDWLTILTHGGKIKIHDARADIIFPREEPQPPPRKRIYLGEVSILLSSPETITTSPAF